MNDISETQNTLESLDLLAAQRQLYSEAKRLHMISVIICVPLVIVWSILVALVPSLSAYAALWGIVVTALELLCLSRLQRMMQTKAARIQQLFDCKVLQFQWMNLNCGIRVEPETIIGAASRYKKNSSCFKLRDWYPVSIKVLPIHQARVICQRSNVWWDAQLRRRYARWIILVLAVLTLAVLLIGLVGGLTLEKLILAILIPLLPAFVFGIRQYIEHQEAADRLDRLREDSESLVQEVISGRYTSHDLEQKSYSLQTQIYDNRLRSPLILDWLYSQLRDENEEKMNRGAEVLVQSLTQHP